MIILLIGLVTILVMLYVFEQNRTKRMRKFVSKIPGPKEYPFVGSTFAFGKDGVELLKNILKMIDDYGPVVKVWLGSTLWATLSDTKDIEVILSSTVHLNKPHTFGFSEKWLGSGLVSSPAAKWKTQRRFLTPAFHFKILETYVDTFNKNATIMVSLLRRELGKEKFDVSDYIDKCTLDIICETSMATSIDAQLNEESEFTRSLKEVTSAIVIRTFTPWLFPNWLFNLSSLGRKFNKHVDYINNYVDQVISQKKKALAEERGHKPDTIKDEQITEEEGYYGTKRRLVFVDLILQYANDMSIELSDKDIRDEVNTFMFAGHDTSASTLNFAIYLLASHPEIQDRVVEEIRSVIGDSDRDPTYQDLNGLKYMEQVIKETLRLYPVVPIVARVLDDDVTIPSGYTLPKGTSVSMTFFKAHRDPEVFSDPEKFNPDNFSPERMIGRFGFAHTPFSAGPRICLGNRFAMLEMKSVLSSFLRTYKIKVKPPEPLLTYQLILRSVTGINIQLEERKSGV